MIGQEDGKKARIEYPPPLNPANRSNNTIILVTLFILITLIFVLLIIAPEPNSIHDLNWSRNKNPETRSADQTPSHCLIGKSIQHKMAIPTLSTTPSLSLLSPSLLSSSLSPRPTASATYIVTRCSVWQRVIFVIPS